MLCDEVFCNQCAVQHINDRNDKFDPNFLIYYYNSLQIHKAHSKSIQKLKNSGRGVSKLIGTIM